MDKDNHCLTRKYAGPVPANSFPDLAKFIARRTAEIRPLETTRVHVHVEIINFGSLAWTVKEWIGQTEHMNTLCSALAPKHSSAMANGFPLGRYCLSCGSAIRKTPTLASWGSSYRMTLRLGLSSFPSVRHIYCSLIQESKNGLASVSAGRTLSRIQWSGPDGNLTLWQAAGSSFVRTRTAFLCSAMYVETALAVSAWNIRQVLTGNRPLSWLVSLNGR
jgi:hypothetical protein